MGAVQPFALAKARQAHFFLREHGEVPRGMLPAPIAQSWERCAAQGLSAARSEHIRCLEPQLHEQRDRHAHLINHATPIMEMLYQQIVNSHSMVVLTNADGFILHSFGDDQFLERAKRIALTPGINWSEDDKGTNAIGTAIVEERPIVVHGHQHFCSSNHFLTCSASPIIDPFGNLIGVLDVTGDHRSYSPHTLGLVKMSVKLVENRMFSNAFPDALVIHFHSRPEYLGTICEGMIAFTPDGQTLAANQNAVVQLGARAQDIAGSTFEQIFTESVRAVLEHITLKPALSLNLQTLNGVRLHCRITPGHSMKAPLRVFTFPRAEEATSPSRPSPRPAAPAAVGQAPNHGHALDRLNTGDPQIALMLGKVRRVIGHDIPILIHGETGVGKELLAQAIHDDGPRHDKPFVAVNCAAIPEGLIESELFGYEEGAFTGAKRRGNCGRLLQADGGTLFLDEIGDMPLALQARLLRVLQERVVNPLGSSKSIPVDIHLVCATHRKLKDWVAAGHFREDLYYRLNGLTVNLPALRNRTDLTTLIPIILAQIAPNGRSFTVDPAVLSMFARHPWPGNIRQLANLLRTAIVMADDDGRIGVEHLPDDFLEEFESQSSCPISQPPTATMPAAAEASDPEPADPGSFAGVLLSTASNLEATTLSLIQRTLELHQGNVSAAARQLGISRNTLYRKLKQIWNV